MLRGFRRGMLIVLTGLLFLSPIAVTLTPSIAAAASQNPLDQLERWFYYHGMRACLESPDFDTTIPGNDNDDRSAADLNAGKLDLTDRKEGFGYIGPELDDNDGNDGTVNCGTDAIWTNGAQIFGFSNVVELICEMNRQLPSNQNDRIKPSNPQDCEASNKFDFDGGDSIFQQALTKALETGGDKDRPDIDLPDNDGSDYDAKALYYLLGKKSLETFCGNGSLIETAKDDKSYDGDDDIVSVDIINKDGTVKPSQSYFLANDDRNEGSTVNDVYYRDGGSANEADDVSCSKMAEWTRDNSKAYSDWAVNNLDKIDQGNEAGTDTTETTTCAIEGIGWIVCPVMSFIGKLNDAAYGFLSSILTIQPALINNTSMSNAWSAFRDIANVAFVIAFMVIVYSQLTSAGVSNYGVKKMLPRIVIAAILVNLSFIVCAIMVDISNIVGSNIYSLLKNSIDVGKEIEADAWGNSIDGILQGAATVAGLILLVVALAMAPMVLLAFLVIILIVVARQALVVLLIVVAPLAFVAYLLPNTESWFKKWWKALLVALMVYPIVGAVFGASTLASRVLMEVAQGGTENKEMFMLMALGVLAIPLFAVPAILKGSLSAAGSVGTKLAGLADRTNRAASGQFKTRAGAEAKALRDATSQRALNRTGILGGIAGAPARMTARRMKRYETLDRSRKAAEKQFGVTDANASRREGRALHDEETASKEEEDFKNRIKLEHLDLNVDLHTRSIESGLNLHNREEEHKNDVAADHMRANPNQYDGLNASRGEKQTADLESKLRFEGSGVGIAQSQDIQGLEDQTAEVKADQRTMYKQSAGGQANQVARKGAEGAEKITDQANELTFQSSAVGTTQSGQMKAVEGELNIVRGEQEIAFEQTGVGQAQAITKDNAAQRKAVVTSRSEAAAVAANADVRIQAQAAKDTLDVAKADEAAFIQELRTDAGAAEYLISQQSPQVQATVGELQTADTQRRVQDQRAANAKTVATEEYAEAVGHDTANPTQLAVAAGGIAGARGISQSQAVARQTMIKGFNEGVAAEMSTMSTMKANIRPGGTRQPGEITHMDVVRDPNASPERRAAAAGMIMKTGGMEDIQELSDVVQNIGGTPKEVDAARDIRMQMAGDMNRTPFGWGASDIAALKRGDVMTDDTGNIKTYDSMSNARAKIKLSPEKWSKLDPDDQKRLKTLSALDESSGGLSKVALENLLEAATSAMTNENIDVTTEAKNHTADIVAAARARGIPIPTGF